MRYLLCALALAGGASANAQTVLYDTFNEDDQSILYDCCNFAQINSLRPNVPVKVQVPFTVPVKTHVVEIDLPLFRTTEFGGMKVLFVGVHGIKHEFYATSFDEAGACCAFVAIGAKGVAVAPGVQYSLLIHGVNRMQGGWNLNTVGATGDYTQWDADGQHDVNGPLPAMRIIGR